MNGAIRRGSRRSRVCARKLRIVAVGFVAGLLACLPVVAQRDTPNGRTDDYGYLAVHGAGCALSFIDIAATGTPLSFTASGTEAAIDDGGALVSLALPFELYGEPSTELVVSTNGYLAPAGSLAIEDGGDFSNDCALPAIPDNNAATTQRVMVAHDDLTGEHTAGAVYWQHFAACPRPSETLGTEPCTVFQWDDWSALDPVAAFDLEAVLYHGSHEIVVQSSGGAPASALADASVGVQNKSAEIALAALCNEPLALDGAAICLIEPRFPVGGLVADLSVDTANRFEALEPGQSVEWEVRVDNLGPSAAVASTVAAAVPPGVGSCQATCTPDVGSNACEAGPISGALADVLDVAPGGGVTYQVACTVEQDTQLEQIVFQASVGAPAGVLDPSAANDQSSDVDRVHLLLFGDGFESGDTTSWDRLVDN